LFFIGIFIAVCLNIDSIELARYLSENKVAREQLARMGEAAASNQIYSSKDSVIAHEALDSIKSSINKAGTLVGLGWGDYGRSDNKFASVVLINGSKDLIAAFKKNKRKSDSLYLVQLGQFRNQLHTQDSNKSAEPRRIVDSLIKFKPQIVAAKQFALLYSNEQYNSSLQRSYVWFRLHDWQKIFGIIITSFAIGLGAPFWFDLLNKIVSLRTAVKTVNSSGSTTSNNSSGSKNDIDG
jgi:hypothetical protein